MAAGTQLSVMMNISTDSMMTGAPSGLQVVIVSGLLTTISPDPIIL